MFSQRKTLWALHHYCFNTDPRSGLWCRQEMLTEGRGGCHQSDRDKKKERRRKKYNFPCINIERCWLFWHNHCTEDIRNGGKKKTNGRNHIWGSLFYLYFYYRLYREIGCECVWKWNCESLIRIKFIVTHGKSALDSAMHTVAAST